MDPGPGCRAQVTPKTKVCTAEDCCRSESEWDENPAKHTAETQSSMIHMSAVCSISVYSKYLCCAQYLCVQNYPDQTQRCSYKGVSSRMIRGVHVKHTTCTYVRQNAGFSGIIYQDMFDEGKRMLYRSGGYFELPQKTAYVGYQDKRGTHTYL